MPRAAPRFRNDVYLTLRGDYGARSTHADPNDPKSAVLHVAAPVYDGGALIGALTVAYPSALLQPIVEGSEAEARRGALWLFGAALAFGAVFNWRLTRAIDLLATYAKTVAAGGKAVPPRLRSRELATLAQALETMRAELEGKQYAERYVQTLTHEMKSPLAAMRGAAELLEDELPEAERRRFALLAREQVERMNQLIERLLGLAALEQRQELADAGPVDLGELLRELLAEKAARFAQRRLRPLLETEENAHVRGERFLLRQALSNLIDNALEFSPDGGPIECRCGKSGGEIRVSIRDHGPGIPDYAQERLFERFYSLPRPGTGKKSTGLGLAFVREVALLHQGRVGVVNAPGGGAEASLNLPAF
jgi:two-component system sensor histidine kinase CreC